MLALSSGLLLSLLALPQSGADTMAFKNAEAARAITEEFSLDHWSEKLLDRSLAEATSPEGKSELLLARCDVLRLKAWRKINDNERLPALGEASTAYVDYLASSPGAERTVIAHRNLGALSKSYGETLVRLIEDGTISGAERSAAIEPAEAIFKTSLTGMNTVINDWEASSEEEKNRTRYTVYFPTVFNRAMVYLYWAQLHEPGSLERDQLAGQAIAALEDFSLGAPFLQSQLANKATGDCYATLGSYEKADGYYTYVIGKVHQVIEDSGAELDTAYRDLLHEVIQDTNHGMMNMQQISGQTAAFWKTYSTMMAWLEEERIDPSRSGYEAMLTAANQMVDDGRAIEAIELSSKIAKDNPNSPLRLKANAVMGRAIALAPVDADIPLDVLYGAAEGAFFQKEYEAAVDGFRLLLPRLSESSDAELYGAHAYYLLGVSWAKLDMPLLAAVSHQVGYEDYPNDEEWAGKNAEKWQKAATLFYNSNTSDKILSSFNDAALEAVTVLGVGGKDLLFQQAKTAHSLAKKAARAKGDSKEIIRLYAKAIRAYEAVDAHSPNYERALLNIALCNNELIPFDPKAADEALALLQHFTKTYLTNSANDPQDPLGRKIRKETEPSSYFYLGHTWRKIAKAGDSSAWQKVIDSFAGMVERFPDQPDLTHTAMSYTVEAYLMLGQLDLAIAEYDKMVALPAIKTRLSIAAYYLYRHYSQLADASLRNEESPIEEQLALMIEQVKYLAAYNRYSRNPNFINLVAEADLHAAIGNYLESAKLFQRVLDNFTTASGYSEQMDFKVRMGLIDALLQTRQVGVAIPLVEKAYAEKPTNLQVMIAVVKVKAGFLSYDGEKVVEVPGEGTVEALALASEMANTLVRLAKSDAGKEDPPVNYFRFAPWWQAKLMHGYVLYQRNLTNAEDKDLHKTLVDSLMKQAPELGANVIGAGKPVAESLRWLLTH